MRIDWTNAAIHVIESMKDDNDKDVPSPYVEFDFDDHAIIEGRIDYEVLGEYLRLALDYSVAHLLNIQYAHQEALWINGSIGMKQKGSRMGHETYSTYDPLTEIWSSDRYVDDDSIVSDENQRSCAKCGLTETSEFHDGCLGKLPNVRNACCGHGIVDDAYIQYADKTCVRGEEALIEFKRIKAKTSRSL